MKRSSCPIGEARHIAHFTVRRSFRLDQLTPARLLQGGSEIQGSSFMREQFLRGFTRERGNMCVWIESLCDCSRQVQIRVISATIEDNVIHELKLFGEKAGRAQLSVGIA